MLKRILSTLRITTPAIQKAAEKPAVAEDTRLDTVVRGARPSAQVQPSTPELPVSARSPVPEIDSEATNQLWTTMRTQLLTQVSEKGEPSTEIWGAYAAAACKQRDYAALNWLLNASDTIGLRPGRHICAVLKEAHLLPSDRERAVWNRVLSKADDWQAMEIISVCNRETFSRQPDLYTRLAQWIGQGKDFMTPMLLMQLNTARGSEPRGARPGTLVVSAQQARALLDEFRQNPLGPKDYPGDRIDGWTAFYEFALRDANGAGPEVIESTALQSETDGTLLATLLASFGKAAAARNDDDSAHRFFGLALEKVGALELDEVPWAVRDIAASMQACPGQFDRRAYILDLRRLLLNSGHRNLGSFAHLEISRLAASYTLEPLIQRTSDAVGASCEAALPGFSMSAALRTRLDNLSGDESLFWKLAPGIDGETFAQGLASGLTEYTALMLAACRHPESQAQLIGRLFLTMNAGDAHSLLTGALTDKFVAQALSQCMQLESISFSDGGGCVNNFGSVSRGLARASQIPDCTAVKAALSKIQMPVVSTNKSFVMRTPDYVQGRTGYYEHGATKVAKDGESEDPLADNLAREHWMMRFVNSLREPLGLRSAVAIPKGEGPVRVPRSNVPASMLQDIDKQAHRFGEEEFRVKHQGGMVTLLQYETDEMRRYATYLNDPVLSPAQLRASSDIGLEDEAKMLKAGMYLDAMTDFMHNHEEQRRFAWNVDAMQRASIPGTGRLSAWRPGVASGNRRAAGNVDMKHVRFIDDAMKEHPLKAMLSPCGDDAPQVALNTIIGESLLGWSLVMTDSWLRRGETAASSGSDNGIDLAAELRHGFSTYISTYTGRPRKQVEALLDNLTDFEAVARELMFFTSDQYVKEASQPGGIKPERWAQLYGPTTQIEWPDPDATPRGWSETGGWMHDGKNRDLGATNGAFPCQRLIALLYLSTSIATGL